MPAKKCSHHRGNFTPQDRPGKNSYDLLPISIFIGTFMPLLRMSIYARLGCSERLMSVVENIYSSFRQKNWVDQRD